MTHLDKRDLDHCDYVTDDSLFANFTPAEVCRLLGWDAITERGYTQIGYVRDLLKHLVKIGRLEQIQPRLPNPTMTFIYRRRRP